MLIHCVAGAHRAGTTACAYLMHQDRSLTSAAAIAECKRQRPVIDPAHDARLMELLRRLQAAHTGVPVADASLAGSSAESSEKDLNEEGHKILMAQQDALMLNDKMISTRKWVENTVDYAARACGGGGGEGAENGAGTEPVVEEQAPEAE